MKKVPKKTACVIWDEAVKGVLRVKSKKPRAPNRDDVDEKIKYLIDEIHKRFSYEKCLITAGVSENIPHSLLVLLVPKDSNDITVGNLDYHYLMYQHGKYGAYEFMCKVEALFYALLDEFDKLVDFIFTGNFERKECDVYESAHSVSAF